MNEEEAMSFVSLLIGLALGMIIGFILSIEQSKPTALDVYRGKTTLEITYKDDVPVDTVVVYKDK